MMAKDIVFGSKDILGEIGSFLFEVDHSDDGLILSHFLPLLLTFRTTREIFNDLLRQHNKEKKQFISKRKNFTNSIPMIQWAISLGCEFNPQEDTLCSYAASHSSIEVIKWARSLTPPHQWSSITFSNAVFQGNLYLLNYLKNENCPWDESTCASAIRGGHFHVLQWLRASEPPCPWSANVCTTAAETNQTHIIHWLREQNPPCPYDATTTRAAAKNGNLDLILWLRSREDPCPWDGWVSALMARRGDLTGLKCLRVLNPPCPWHEEVLVYAALGGCVGLLQWLRDQGMELHISLWFYYDVIRSGPVGVLNWLRSEDPNFPRLHAGLCAHSAREGKLEMIQWLRAQDPPCPWNEFVCAAAAANGHLKVLKWLRSQNPPCPWKKEMLLTSALVKPYVKDWISRQA